MTAAITRVDLSAADLREAAARTQDAKATRRMLAIALVLEGWSREAAAEACGLPGRSYRFRPNPPTLLCGRPQESNAFVCGSTFLRSSAVSQDTRSGAARGTREYVCPSREGAYEPSILQVRFVTTGEKR
jgi:hypothetical protein